MWPYITDLQDKLMTYKNNCTQSKSRNIQRMKFEGLTILSKSSPPSTNSRTMYIFDLLAITYEMHTC